MFLPELSLRSFTDDFIVLDKVLHNNFYRINKFDKDDIVIDIGAHIGVFTFTCFAAGAGKIYSFEPFIENYRLLLKNIDSLRSTDKIIPHQIGLSMQTCNLSFTYPEVENRFYNFSNILIDNINAKKSYICPCISLNSMLSSYALDEKIELLKLNIGNREIELLDSPFLPLKVKNICGQVTSTDKQIIEFQDKMKSIGYKDSYISKIKNEEDKYVFFLSKEKLSDRFDLDIK